MTSKKRPSKSPTSKISQTLDSLDIAQPCKLTYKSIVADACHLAGLQAYEDGLDGYCAWRYIFASEKFLAWYSNQLPQIGTNEEDSGRVQLASEFFGFIDGTGLAYGTDVHPLDPVGSGVWELKTQDLRIFGWFPCVNFFIAHLAEEKNKLENFGAYTPYVREVQQFRSSITPPLPAPIMSEKLADVVSNRIRSFRPCIRAFCTAHP